MRSKMDATTARTELSDALNRVAYGAERILLLRHGKPVAALIPVQDLELLERLIEEEEDRIDIAEAKRILADPNETWVPWEQVEAELWPGEDEGGEGEKIQAPTSALRAEDAA